jgi:hypothetical protein
MTHDDRSPTAADGEEVSDLEPYAEELPQVPRDPALEAGDPPATVRDASQTLGDPPGDAADDGARRWDPRTQVADQREGG